LRGSEQGIGFEKALAAPWAALLAARARRAGLTVPDAVFGLAWSGAFDRERLSAVLGRLPPGLVEIYLHPATTDDFPGHAPGYRYRDELAALTDPAVAAAVARSGRVGGGYADIVAAVGNDRRRAPLAQQ
jgi:hypothetical protein